MTRWFVPGRIEVLGKHTDYAGGSTLVAAVDRGVTISIEPGDSGIAVSTDAAP
ncbi:galactokinase family protein, partial [Cutibacterium acnes subsp. acnes]|nr:galactokinase family protein [Cutibacterium acnes subsp. acnes]